MCAPEISGKSGRRPVSYLNFCVSPRQQKHPSDLCVFRHINDHVLRNPLLSFFPAATGLDPSHSVAFFNHLRYLKLAPRLREVLPQSAHPGCLCFIPSTSTSPCSLSLHPHHFPLAQIPSPQPSVYPTVSVFQTIITYFMPKRSSMFSDGSCRGRQW